MSRHAFIESAGGSKEFHRLIYCHWCGMVVWHFNKNENSDIKPSELQSKVGTPCINPKLNETTR